MRTGPALNKQPVWTWSPSLASRAQQRRSPWNNTPAALRRCPASYVALVPPPAFCSKVSCSPLLTPQGKEIIEYYLRELEEEGVTHIPRWTPPVVPSNGRPQLLPPPSSARAIPAKGAKSGADGKDPAELTVGTPDGLCLAAVFWRSLFAPSSETFQAGGGTLSWNADRWSFCFLLNSLI